MAKKSFALIIAAVLVTFALTFLVKYYRPASAGDVDFDDFPLTLGQWQGERETVSQGVLDLLNPKDIFSGTYINAQGVKIHLLFDFFSSEADFGGPHSPRNCLPGSGWMIRDTYDNRVACAGSDLSAGRFELELKGARKVMDFWYVTRFGETASDYEFKWHLLLSSLSFKPRDVAFVRFVADADPESLEALKDFQRLAVEEIYRRLPFD